LNSTQFLARFVRAFDSRKPAPSKPNVLVIGGARPNWPNLAGAKFKPAHDGFEREFKLFDRVEDGMCTRCAPGGQRKSRDNQREQAELNTVECQRRTDVSGDGVISFGKRQWR
jgi:hypothetical protein